MSIEKVKAIGGLIAVCSGIAAVTGLAVFTIILLGSSNKESVVAIASSALGIISAMVGAYLGIKITADSNAKTGEMAGHAAVANHERDVAQQKTSGMEEKLDELAAKGTFSPQVAEAVKEAGSEAEQAVRTVGPPPGGAAR